jgi:hypothetical protein
LYLQRISVCGRFFVPRSAKALVKLDNEARKLTGGTVGIKPPPATRGRVVS